MRLHKRFQFNYLSLIITLISALSLPYLQAQSCSFHDEPATTTTASTKTSVQAKGDCNLTGQVLHEFTEYMRGNLALSVAQRNEKLDQFKANWDGCYVTIPAEVRAFMAQYESTHPPLFESSAWVDPTTFEPEAQVLFIVQQWLFDHAFVAGKLDTVRGIAFESANIFPGPVSADAPRVDAQVSVSATYNTDPAYFISGQDTVRRMTGYYAAPGERVRVEVDPRFAGLGLRVMVGVQQLDLAPVWSAFNRFPRIGNSFPIEDTVTEVANPFGGGIYITVPDGTNLGEMNVTLRNVVKTPYFSIRSGAATTPASWQNEMAQSGVQWFDWEADYFMMTLPISMVRDIQDPTEILDKWSRSMVSYARLTGRPTTRIRAEYFSIDRQIAASGTRMTAQYPMLTPDPSAPFIEGSPWWSPLKVTDGEIPSDVIFHEMGHLHNMPTLAVEIESNVNLPAVFIYNEIYGMDIDQALVHSRHQLFTREEAAIDWMVSSNFRSGKRMGYNNVDYPVNWPEQAYSQRGHAKWVDLAALFDWDALGRVNQVFYEEQTQSKPLNTIADDDMIRTASQALNANVAPLFEFWGILPSDALFDELADLPRPQKILDRLLRYRTIAPTSPAKFAYYHERMKDRFLNGMNRARFDAYLDTLDQAACQAIGDRVDAIIRKYYGDQAVRDVPAEIDIEGLQLYLTTDSIIAAEGEHLLAWKDASGNGFHAVTPNANVAHAPRFMLHGTDGKPVVRFNGERADGMAIDNRLNLGLPYTVFVVDAYTSAGQHRGRSLHSRNRNWLLGRWQTTSTHYAEGWVGSNVPNSGVDTFAIHTAVGNLDGSHYFLNGINRTHSQAPQAAPGLLGIAAHGGNFSNETSDLDVAEIIVFDRVLTEAERTAIHAYLARKYFKPYALPDDGLQVMLRAEAISIGDGEPISIWADQSGNQNHGIKVTRSGDFQPIFVAGDEDRPPVVHFIGDQRSGMDIASDLNLTRPYTIFLVDAYNSQGANRGRGLHARGSNWLLGRWNGNTGHYAAGWVTNFNNTAEDDVFEVHVAVGTRHQSFYYRNGENETVSTNPAGNPGQLGLNAHSGNFNNEVSDLDVAEVFIYDRVLTQNEIELITRYLKAKYRK